MVAEIAQAYAERSGAGTAGQSFRIHVVRSLTALFR